MSQRTGTDKGSKGKKSNKDKHVVDFTEVRARKLEEKRRNTERIFFKQILGMYCVVGNKDQLRQIEILDVSEEGCSFQVPFDPDDPWPSSLKELDVRLYFSQDTYIPIQLTIQNSRPSIDDGRRYMRFGCSVDQSLSTYKVYCQFVRFLSLYSEHAHRDMGDVTLFYL